MTLASPLCFKEQIILFYVFIDRSGISLFYYERKISTSELVYSRETSERTGDQRDNSGWSNNIVLSVPSFKLTNILREGVRLRITFRRLRMNRR